MPVCSKKEGEVGRKAIVNQFFPPSNTNETWENKKDTFEVMHTADGNSYCGAAVLKVATK